MGNVLSKWPITFSDLPEARRLREHSVGSAKPQGFVEAPGYLSSAAMTRGLTAEQSKEGIRYAGLREVVRPGVVSTAGWTAFTPGWTSSSGSQPVIGNGTLYGRYVRMAFACLYHIVWLAGPTTTFGAGYWRFTLPVAIAPGLGDFPTGPAMAYDASAAKWWVGTAYVDTSLAGNQVYLILNDTAGQLGAATVLPGTTTLTGTGDQIRVGGTYPIALA